MVATPRPLSTENETLHTQRLIAAHCNYHYTRLPIQKQGEIPAVRLGGNGKNDLCCTCCGAVYGLFSVPALLFCRLADAMAGAHPTSGPPATRPQVKKRLPYMRRNRTQ